MKKILVLNGPNMNMLGVREPQIYGSATYADLCEKISAHAEKIGVAVDFFQSNHEGVLIDKIQETLGVYDGIVFNPAAYTHTSIAIADAIKAVGVPTVEVHISDINTREDFRKINYISPVCVKTIIGHGRDGYCEALDYLLSL